MSLRPEHPLHRRRRGRNLGVLTVLGAFVVLIFVVTLVKLGPKAANPVANDSWSTMLGDWITGKASDE